MSKVIGKRILPGGNVVLKPSKEKEITTLFSDIPETPKYEIKAPGKVIPKQISIPNEIDDIPFLVVSESNKLQLERIITAGSGIKFFDGGPNNNFVISVKESEIKI
ncbi:MAG: hypothetical protein NZZ41_08230, partial [Candidatus Dojkabacteria bacterium]|nr:hypothetical protein [Candidatus Dojkabacteria bacterium]